MGFINFLLEGAFIILLCGYAYYFAKYYENTKRNYKEFDFNDAQKGFRYGIVATMLLNVGALINFFNSILTLLEVM